MKRACGWWAVAVWLLMAGCDNSRKQTGKTQPEPVPETFQVLLETSRGEVLLQVHKQWAPEGAERFYRLVRARYYDGARFFRVVRRFVAQFGIHPDPAVSARWRGMVMADDPVRQSNLRGSLSFAHAGPNTRTTQVFINLADNTRLDKLGFAPFARVISGMEIADRLYSDYGDGPPNGGGPDQRLIELQGNSYLERQFPRLDYIIRARVQ